VEEKTEPVEGNSRALSPKSEKQPNIDQQSAQLGNK
jgi:hypothetical protein